MMTMDGGRAVLRSVVLAGMLTLPLCAQQVSSTNAPTNTPSQEDLKKIIQDQGIYIQSSKPGIVLSGYVDAGYTYGFQGNDTVIPEKKATDDKPGSNFGLNALKLAIEKPLSGTNDFDAGFRADLIYGQDAGIIDGNGNTGATDSGGANSSDLFLEQAFVQFNAPIGNGIKFVVGKFASPLGYEVIERPSNMNITYGNLFTDITPTDHTGVLATYKFNDTVTVQGGLVDGINTSTGTSFGPSDSDGIGLLGTVNLTAAGGNANVQNGFYVGLNPNANSGATAANLGDPNNGATYAESSHALWVYDVYGQWKPKAAKDKLTLAAEGDCGSYATSTLAGDNSTTWTAAALYAKYQFTKIFSLANRVDWMHNDDGQKFATLNPGSPNAPQDIYSETITAEIDAWENMLLRAEYRLDWGETVGDLSPSASTPTFTSTTATTKGPAQMVDLEVVYSF